MSAYSSIQADEATLSALGRSMGTDGTPLRDGSKGMARGTRPQNRTALVAQASASPSIDDPGAPTG